MSNETMAEAAAGVNPASMGGLVNRDKLGLHVRENSGKVVDETAGNESRTSGDLVAVKLTQAEWDEQDKLLIEYGRCIIRDRDRAAEILPKIIWPAWMLKVDKKLMGANHIRKKGYNTMDADLAYGPGWLDMDDGGPVCTCSEDYKPYEGYEIPKGWRE